jgi:hypothetical protein
MGLVFDEYLYQSDLTDNYNKNNNKKNNNNRDYGRA